MLLKLWELVINILEARNLQLLTGIGSLWIYMRATLFLFGHVLPKPQEILNMLETDLPTKFLLRDSSEMKTHQSMWI